MDKGIVLEKLGTHVLVLTPEGEFKKVKYNTSNIEIGEEVRFSCAAYRLTRYIAVVAAVLVLIIATFSVFELQNSRVIACITVDINPSVELGINKNLKVNRVVALNPEGIKLIQKVQLKNMTIDETLNVLVDEAIQAGYIARDKENDVLVAAVMLDDVGEKSLEIIKTAEKVKERIEETEYKINYEVVETDKQTLDKAKEMGISAGKYMIYLEAKKAGLELDPEELKKNGIGKELKAKGVSPDELIRNMKQKGKKQADAPPAIKEPGDKIDKITGADQKDESEGKARKEPGENKKGLSENDETNSGKNVKSPPKDADGHEPGKERSTENADGDNGAGTVIEDTGDKTQNMPGNMNDGQNRNEEITGGENGPQNPQEPEPDETSEKRNDDKRNENKKSGKRDNKP